LSVWLSVTAKLTAKLTEMTTMVVIFAKIDNHSLVVWLSVWLSFFLAKSCDSRNCYLNAESEEEMFPQASG